MVEINPWDRYDNYWVSRFYKFVFEHPTTQKNDCKHDKGKNGRKMLVCESLDVSQYYFNIISPRWRETKFYKRETIQESRGIKSFQKELKYFKKWF